MPAAEGGREGGGVLPCGTTLVGQFSHDICSSGHNSSEEASPGAGTGESFDLQPEKSFCDCVDHAAHIAFNVLVPSAVQTVILPL